MDVFVYGTLTEPEQVEQVVDAYAFVGSATLDGLHPVEGAYPTLAPGGTVGGRILRTEDAAALDAYEGVDTGLYVRVSVPWANPDTHDTDTVEVYVGDPDRLRVDADVSWPEGSSFRRQVERYLDANSVVVRSTD